MAGAVPWKGGAGEGGWGRGMEESICVGDAAKVVTISVTFSHDERMLSAQWPTSIPLSLV